MNIKEAREKMNMSRREVSNWLDIPYRSMCSWENGERECPPYVEKLIVEKILEGRHNTTKYELKRRTAEISWKDRATIAEGCTMDDQEPETVKSFKGKGEALDALKDYTTKIREMSDARGVYYLVEEYCIEVNTYDADDEWLSGGDVLEWSKMQIEVVESSTYETVAVCSNYKEAEKEMDDYDGDEDVYLSFE